jgi:hypothetical protein
MDGSICRSFVSAFVANTRFVFLLLLPSFVFLLLLPSLALFLPLHLGVVSQEVIDIEACSGDGRKLVEAGVGSVPVVLVRPCWE